MTQARITNQEKSDGTGITFAMIWKFATGIVLLCFPFAMGAGGYFAGKVFDHEKQLAVMQVSYTTKDDTDLREKGLKQSIDGLKSTINDLRIDIVKLADKASKEIGK